MKLIILFGLAIRNTKKKLVSTKIGWSDMDSTPNCKKRHCGWNSGLLNAVKQGNSIFKSFAKRVGA